MLKNIVIILALLLPTACVTNTVQTPKPAHTNLTEKTDTLIRLGDNMLSKGDRQAAHSFYMRAHESQPSAHQPIFKVFDLLMQNNQIDEADLFMQHVTSINEDDMKLAISYARFLMNYKRDNARPFLKKASEHFKDIRFYNWYGVALDLNGQHVEAQGTYKKGLFLNNKSNALRNNLALSYAVTYKREHALDLFDQLIADNPDKLLYKKNKAITHILYGEMVAAQETIYPDMNMVEFNNLVARYKDQLDRNTPLGLLKMINGL